MREINEQFENDIMPVFKKTSDFKQRLKELNMIPCFEHSLEIQAVLKLKYFILIMKYSQYIQSAYYKIMSEYFYIKVTECQSPYNYGNNLLRALS